MRSAVRFLPVLLLSSGVALFASPAAAQLERWEAEGWGTDFTRFAVDFAEIRTVIPRDNIPAIDNPAFVPAGEETELTDQEPVIGLVLNGEAKAYPLRVMIWHEIANDTIGGVPVTVTYCPLCNTAIAFEREVDGAVLDFGTTGKLRFSDLVMYDRQTESWWQQFTGRAIVGDYTGTQLPLVPSRLMSWGEFREEHPSGLVLVPNDPQMRDYWRNPYAGYDSATAPFLFDGQLPTGMAAMQRVVLVRSDPLMAFTLAMIAARGEIIRDGVTIRFVPGQVSALDARAVADGQEVGGVRVFRTRAGVEVPVAHDVTFAFVVNAFEPHLDIETGD